MCFPLCKNDFRSAVCSSCPDESGLGLFEKLISLANVAVAVAALVSASGFLVLLIIWFRFHGYLGD